MMWDVVLEAWRALLLADTALTTALGGEHVNLAQASREVRVPSVDWSLVTDNETESWNPITVQVDIFAASLAQAITIERRIRLLTHRDVARDLGGHQVWTRYLDSRSHPYTEEPGTVHRSLDFQFEPLRAQYAAAT